MKTTYLVRKTPGDSSSVLIEITKDEWHQMIEKNRGLPVSERRLFIADIIAEGKRYDCLVIGVGYDEYRSWHAEKKKSDRNREFRKNYQHISLSSELLEEVESFQSCITADEALVISELEKMLAKWNKWALPVCKLYASGKKDEVVKFIMVTCGVSKATAYRYIQEFKDFVKEFLEA